MIIKTATFVTSSTKNSQCPAPDMPEFAFIGRSNVGKSSLINMLTNQNKLAKTSGTPGKTQTINHFLINSQWYLVDLPGYGYAKVSKKMRATFEAFIRSYILNRENLACLFVLVDSRHEPQAIDVEFIRWLGEESVPFAIITTKTDKITPSVLAKNIEIYKTRLLEEWEELPPMFLSSSQKKHGRDEILNYIEDVVTVITKKQ